MARIFEEWDAGLIARYSIDVGLMSIVDDSNVDALVEALPDWYQPEYVTRLRAIAAVDDPGSLISIFGGVRLEVDAQSAARETAERVENERLVATARGWASRHPSAPA